MKMQLPQTSESYWTFDGGLDQVTPPIQIKPSVCRSTSNIEIGINGGYSRIGGYERFDGRPKPSDAVYHILAATITGSYATGNTLTGATSGATGVICTTGASGYFVLTKVTGTFQSGENLQIAAVTVAVATAANLIGAASTLALNATYLNLAADQYRADILVVPGSGNVLGVWQYNDKVYAFRNNAGGTAAVMHESSSSGWVAVSLGREITWGTGTAAVTEGQTLTGATSGASGVVTRVVLRSGSYGGSNAIGSFIFATVTGTFQNGENLQVGGVTKCVATAADAAITLSPSGRFEFDNWNFGGGTGTKRMYGCDGVNKAFEFDGTVFVPIRTGMTTDTPTHIKAHRNHLFLSFVGSAQHSGVGNPYTWTIVSGSGELACGDTIAGFLAMAGSETGAALVMYTRNRTLVLYGSSSSDWNLVTYSDESGALPYTIQFIRTGMVLDDNGIKTLSATQAYGNFHDAIASDKIMPTLNDLVDSASASCIVRKKGQYRLFFSGGEAVYVTFRGNKIAGMTTVSLTDEVRCICSQEGASGQEEIYFGSDSGYVYQMDVGTSFDGESIDWSFELSFNHFGSPRQLKSFRKAVIEVSGGTYCEFQMTHVPGYGSSSLPSVTTTTVQSELSAAVWDDFSWDAFFWDGSTLIPAEADLDSTAENMALAFSGSSDEFDTFTLNGAIVSYSPRRALR